MKKIIEYDVTIATGQFAIIDQVNEKIQYGWQPIGGVSIIIDDDDEQIYFQTLVKYED